MVNNDSLNLRAGPGQDYAVLGVFTQGVRVGGNHVDSFRRVLKWGSSD